MFVGAGRHKRMVDLRLHRAADGLAPVVPLVPFSIGSPADGVTFDQLGVGVGLEGAAGAFQQVGNVAWAANTLPDTDVAIEPITVGAEMWLQLRSPRAPEEFRLPVSMPAGAVLKTTAGGSVSVVDGDRTLLFVPAVSATDAAGQPVQVSLGIDGRNLLLHVSHRGNYGVVYPVSVDPIYSANSCNPDPVVQDNFDWYSQATPPCPGSSYPTSGTGPSGGTELFSYPSNPVPYQGWMYLVSSGASFSTTIATWFWGNGMYIWANANQSYSPGQWAEYIYKAPAGAFIQRVDFGDQAHLVWQTNSSYMYAGIWNPSQPPYGGWEPESDFDGGVTTNLGNAPEEQYGVVSPSQVPGGQSDMIYVGSSTIPDYSSTMGANGNEAAFGLAIATAGTRTSSASDWAFIYGATVWLYDKTDPTISSGAPASSTQWVDDGGQSYSVTPTAVDNGVGVKSLSLLDYNPKTGAWNQFQPRTNPCSGDHTGSYCPASWSATFTYQLSEGEHDVVVGAEDAVQNPATQSASAEIDRSSPNAPTFSGVLWDQSTAGGALSGLAYPLQITGVDPGDLSGPAEFDVSVDGGPPTVVHSQCQSSYGVVQCGQLSGGNRQATVTYLFQSTEYAAGPHTICVTVKDQVGQSLDQPIANCRSGVQLAAHTNQASFTIDTQPPASLGDSQNGDQNDQLGLESFYDYRKLATGAGSYARVNLANGNLVWDDVPVVNPGQGLSTFVEFAYNSQHRLGDLAPLSGQPFAPNLEYDQAGPGWSLGIDGLTRLNEPLDLSLAAGTAALTGRISFTDVDGTRHTFVQDPNDSQHWIAPPGVFLWLRQWSTSDPSKAWAITRPDGVTFFFDQDGYETSIEDRQQNTMTFQRQAVIADVVQGAISSCPVGAPGGVDGCIERVTSVQDQGRQRMQVCYYDTTSEAGCPGGTISAFQSDDSPDLRLFKVEDIIDHAGHDLHFDYDQGTGSLTEMTAVDGTSASRTFKFAYGGASDATPAVGATVTGAVPPSSGLTASLIPPGLTQITDPDGHSTQIQYCAPGAVDSSSNPLPCTQDSGNTNGDPCPQDLSNPTPPTYGGLVGLEPKCVWEVIDRGGGVSDFRYTTGVDSSGNEIHTADVQGPRTDPPGSGTRPDHWVDTTDVFGRPTRELDPLSRTTLLTWANTGQGQPANTLQQLVQASGSADQVTTLYSYDQNGRLTDRQGPASTSSGSQEDQNFREVKIAYRLSAGTLVAPSGADAAHCSSSDTSLCFVSDPASLTNQDNQTTTFTLDPANPADGLITSVTDAAGEVWGTAYDSFGRVISQTEPGSGGGSETTGYGSFDPKTGLPQTETLPADPSNPNQVSVWHYAYDSLGNLLAVTDPRANLPATAPASTSPSAAYTTTFAYDALSRVVRETDSVDSAGSPGSYTTKTFAYDPDGNLTSRVDADGHTFTYAFTPMDWLASESTPAVTQADGTTKPAETTSFCYDEQGDQTDQVQPAGQPATCTLGAPAASDHATHMWYDGDGELLVSEQLGSLDGASNQLTGYAYDNRGDRVGMADPAENNGETYQQAEQNAQSATSGTLGAWRTRTFYDAAGDPVETEQNPDASDGTVYVSREQYDAGGLLVASEDARGPQLTATSTTGEFPLSSGVADTTVYAFDPRGLLDQVTDPAGDVTQIERAPDGKICAITSPRGPSGVSEGDCSASPGNYKTTFSYYAQGWLRQIGLPTGPGENWYGSEPMTVSYTRDPGGYPTTITDPRGTTIANSFFDDGELKSTSAPWWWTYDPQGTGLGSPDPNTGAVGQVAAETPGGGLPIREKTLQELYQANAASRQPALPTDAQAGKLGQVAAEQLPGILPSAGQTSFAYDGNGNLTAVTDASTTQPTTTIAYDELGEPIEIDQPFDGSNLTKTYYGYDPDGNLAFSDTPQVTGSAQNADDQTYRTTYSYDGLDRPHSVIAPGAGSAPGASAVARETDYCYATAPAQGSSPCTPSGQPAAPVQAVANASGQTFATTQRVAVTKPLNGSTATDNITYQDYDALGNLISSTAPAIGNSATPTLPQTTFAYDQIGDQTLVLRPDGQPSQNGGSADLHYATQMTYGPAGRLASRTANQTETTTYGYDPDGNLTQVSAPGAASASGESQVAQIIDYAYNGRDLLWKTTTGAGSPGDGQSNLRTTVTESDADGNPIRTVNPAGVSSTGSPFNTYDGSYTSAGAGSDSTGAANLNATIRVYNQDNQLTDVYRPWGCELSANSDKTACASASVTDTRRFKEHLAVNTLGQITGITEAYDWSGSGSGIAGPNSPTMAADVPGPGGLRWANLSNAEIADGKYATAGERSNTWVNTDQLQMTGYQFNIPSTATIQGIQVDVLRKAIYSARDTSIQLIKGGVAQPANRSQRALWPGTPADASFGGPDDLWGTSWTPSDINNSRFGAAIIAQTNGGQANNNAQADVDQVSITVYYASASQYKTSYSYYPNGWINTETAPTTNLGATLSSTYTYDAAGDQLSWQATGQTPGSSCQRTSARTFWPSGQVEQVNRTQGSSGCAAISTAKYDYYYDPSGAESQADIFPNGASTASDTELLGYFPDGHLHTANEQVPSASPLSNLQTYDTTYTYDPDGNVATRQQGGQYNSTADTYMNGTRSYFAYNGDDQEIRMDVDENGVRDGIEPHRTFTTSYWPSGQPEQRTRIQCTLAPGSQDCSGTPITESYYYNDDGTLSQDTRSSDNKNQTYTYDTDGNRTTDEIGTHLYNALDQEVQWTRGSSQDQASGGSTVNYVLDGTGGLLEKNDSAGLITPTGTYPLTTWYCSANTIGNVQGLSGSGLTPPQVAGKCAHDANRAEVAYEYSSGQTITNPTQNYCYDSLAQLDRITIASCPATDQAINSLSLQPGETQATTAVYQHDSFGNQTATISADAKSPSTEVDFLCYSYDALERRYAKAEQITTTWPASPSCPNSSGQSTGYGYIGQSNQIAFEEDPDPSNLGTLVPQFYDYNSQGQKLGVWEGPSTANPQGAYHTYAIDAKGSVEALENADNTISNLNRYHYTPYGDLEKGKAQGGGSYNTTTPEQALGTDAQNNNYRFEGFYLDSGIDTYDLQARNYRPQDSLYTSQDTFEAALGDQQLRADPLTQNLYAFAGGNPTTNIEWDGHYAESPCGPGCEVYNYPGGTETIVNNGTTATQRPAPSGGTVTTTYYPNRPPRVEAAGPSGSSSANAVLKDAATLTAKQTLLDTQQQISYLQNVFGPAIAKQAANVAAHEFTYAICAHATENDCTASQTSNNNAYYTRMLLGQSESVGGVGFLGLSSGTLKPQPGDPGVEGTGDLFWVTGLFTGGIEDAITGALGSESVTVPEDELLTSGKLYVNGTATANNLTPRLVDENGLSAFDTLERATPPGGKAQCFEVACLSEGGLGAFRDEPPEGHVSIRPLAPEGLPEWLASRASGTYGESPYTQFLQSIAEAVRRPSG